MGIASALTGKKDRWEFRLEDFVHLHVHTHYSVLDGLHSSKRLAHRVKEMGQVALAITDHGVLYGWIDHYLACQKVGIKPILGLEAYVAPLGHRSRGKGTPRDYHITLLAMNEAGYRNLLRLSSISFLEGFYRKPRIDRPLLRRYNEGIIALSGCLNGEILVHLRHDDEDEAQRALENYLDIFGERRFYLELQWHTQANVLQGDERREREERDKVLYRRLITLGQRWGVPFVLTNDTHYAEAKDAQAHDLLLAVQMQKRMREPDRMRMGDSSYYLKSTEEMVELAREMEYPPESIANTRLIADACNVEISFAPPYYIPSALSVIEHPQTELPSTELSTVESSSVVDPPASSVSSSSVSAPSTPASSLSFTSLPSSVAEIQAQVGTEERGTAEEGEEKRRNGDEIEEEQSRGAETKKTKAEEKETKREGASPEGQGNRTAKNADEILARMARRGLEERLRDGRVRRHTDEEYWERLEYELDIIRQMHFSDYFLIIEDVVRWMRENGILWNVRGSGAGSLVLYALKVTDIDPLAHDLIFERFLNPERVNMPDVDLDVIDKRRGEVIAYTQEKYGADRTAAIITFGMLGGRSGVRRAGWALDLPLSFVDRISKLIPQKGANGRSMSVRRALEEVEELRRLYEEDEQVRLLLDMADGISEAMDKVSTHAAGIVVGDRPLVEVIPLRRPTTSTKKGDEIPIDRVTQWDMDAVDRLGLLKIDYLGLRTLHQLSLMLEQTADIYGVEMGVGDIPYEPYEREDVRRTFELLSRGDGVGVFQVESEGMRQTLQAIRPRSIDDIAAAIALYRPGPLQHIPTFAARANGEEKPKYRHPKLKEILTDTYGVFVFQEQIMRAAMVLAGFTGPEADFMRKVVAKKKKEYMPQMRKKFVEGAVKLGTSRAIAEEIWDEDILPFASYGFNRAHATDYALLTLRTAYFKANYPAAFWVAVLSTERRNYEQVAKLVADMRRHGIQLLPPSVLHSDLLFTAEYDVEEKAAAVEGGARKIRLCGIRVGLGSIKEVGDDAVKAILEARAVAPFTSVRDFYLRFPPSKLSQSRVVALVKAGALDELHPDYGKKPIEAIRAEIMAYVQNHKRTKKGKKGGKRQARALSQMSLFDLPEEPLPAAPPLTRLQLLEWEQGVLGYYLNEHPIAGILERALRMGEVNGRLAQVTESNDGRKLIVLGILRDLRIITTKKGDEMAFADLYDGQDATSLTIFPDLWQSVRDVLRSEESRGMILKVRGYVNVWNGRVSLVAQSISAYSGAGITGGASTMSSGAAEREQGRDANMASESPPILGIIAPDSQNRERGDEDEGVRLSPEPVSPRPISPESVSSSSTSSVVSSVTSSVPSGAGVKSASANSPHLPAYLPVRLIIFPERMGEEEMRSAVMLLDRILRYPLESWGQGAEVEGATGGNAAGGDAVTGETGHTGLVRIYLAWRKRRVNGGKIATQNNTETGGAVSSNAIPFFVYTPTPIIAPLQAVAEWAKELGETRLKSGVLGIYRLGDNGNGDSSVDTEEAKKWVLERLRSELQRKLPKE